MLTLDQYLKLQRGDQVRLYREVYTVDSLVDEGTHVERILVSESGDIKKNAIYLVHLMAYHGSVDVPEESISTSRVDSEPRVQMKDPNALTPAEESELKAYELSELI
jgi:hypothetical protein